MLKMEGKSSLNRTPSTQGLRQFLQLKEIGPKTYSPKTWWKGRPVIKYQERQYAWLTAYVDVMIYRERGLIAAGRKEIKNKEGFLALLQTICLPPWVSWFQSWGHRLYDSFEARDNMEASCVETTGLCVESSMKRWPMYQAAVGRMQEASGAGCPHVKP